MTALDLDVDGMVNCRDDLRARWWCVRCCAKVLKLPNGRMGSTVEAGQDERRRQQQRSTHNPANERADNNGDIRKSPKRSMLFVECCMVVSKDHRVRLADITDYRHTGMHPYS